MPKICQKLSKEEASDKGHNQQVHTCKIPTNEFTLSKATGLPFTSLLKHHSEISWVSYEFFQCLVNNNFLENLSIM